MEHAYESEHSTATHIASERAFVYVFFQRTTEIKLEKNTKNKHISNSKSLPFCVLLLYFPIWSDAAGKRPPNEEGPNIPMHFIRVISLLRLSLSMTVNANMKSKKKRKKKKEKDFAILSFFFRIITLCAEADVNTPTRSQHVLLLLPTSSVSYTISYTSTAPRSTSL